LDNPEKVSEFENDLLYYRIIGNKANAGKALQFLSVSKSLEYFNAILPPNHPKLDVRYPYLKFLMIYVNTVIALPTKDTIQSCISTVDNTMKRIIRSRLPDVRFVPERGWVTARIFDTPDDRNPALMHEFERSVRLRDFYALTTMHLFKLFLFRLKVLNPGPGNIRLKKYIDIIFEFAEKGKDLFQAIN